MTQLTKREQIAAMAMQGMLASPGSADAFISQQMNFNSSLVRILCIASVDIADALIAELEKEEG